MSKSGLLQISMPPQLKETPKKWECRRCKHICELQDGLRSQFSFEVQKPTPHIFRFTWTVCPNLACQEVTLVSSLHTAAQCEESKKLVHGKQLHHWILLPRRPGESFPDYIPKHLLKDYEESCAIKALSPNAAAMLARRCLHGLIRDVWKTKAGRLVDEIDAIKEQVDPHLWEALDGIRLIGNIGAHQAEEPNGSANVKPKEVEQILRVLAMLFHDWYIAPAEKHRRLAELKAAAKSRCAQEKGAAPSTLPAAANSRRSHAPLSAAELKR